MFKLMVLSVMVFAADPAKYQVGVKGMVCSFCAQGIEKKLKALDSIDKVNVDLDAKKVSVEAKAGKKIDAEAVNKIIKDAGYEVVTPEKGT